MCFAFFTKIADEPRSGLDMDKATGREQDLIIFTMRGIEQQVTSRKRSADTCLERQQTKVAKRNNDMQSPQLDASKEIDVRDDIDSADRDSISLKESLAKAEARIKELENTQKILRKEKDDLKYEVIEFQVEAEQRTNISKAKDSERKAYTKNMVKKAEERFKVDYEKKHEKMKDLFQKKIDSAREQGEEKIRELVQQIKNDKAEHAKVQKEMKAEHLRVQKELKAEHQEQVKLWKPEHSKAVKEKNDLLKARQKESTSLEQELDKCKQKLEQAEKIANRLLSQRTRLEQEVKEKNGQIEKLRDSLKRGAEESNRLETNNEKLAASLSAKIAREEESWQLQTSRAEQNAEELKEQQSTNNVLRESLDDSKKRIENLEALLMGAQDRIQSLEVDGVTKEEASTQTEYE